MFDVHTCDRDEGCRADTTVEFSGAHAIDATAF